jgi:steroid 5-alpha reductase family enzyme
MVCWYHFHPHLTWHLEAITHDFSDNFFETLFRPDLVYLKSSDPFVSLLFISLWFAFLTGLAGWITQEFSWVDRIWSLTPPFYAWLFALHPFLALGEAWPSSIGGYFFGRPFLLAWLTTLWGGRLTYNFWRKGGYAGGAEDYRWAEVRTWFSHFTLQMFNIFFIAMFQVRETSFFSRFFQFVLYSFVSLLPLCP